MKVGPNLASGFPCYKWMFKPVFVQFKTRAKNTAQKTVEIEFIGEHTHTHTKCPLNVKWMFVQTNTMQFNQITKKSKKSGYKLVVSGKAPS